MKKKLNRQVKSSKQIDLENSIREQIRNISENVSLNPRYFNLPQIMDIIYEIRNEVVDIDYATILYEYIHATEACSSKIPFVIEPIIPNRILSLIYCILRLIETVSDIVIIQMLDNLNNINYISYEELYSRFIDMKVHHRYRKTLHEILWNKLKYSPDIFHVLINRFGNRMAINSDLLGDKIISLLNIGIYPDDNHLKILIDKVITYDKNSVMLELLFSKNLLTPVDLVNRCLDLNVSVISILEKNKIKLDFSDELRTKIMHNYFKYDEKLLIGELRKIAKKYSFKYDDKCLELYSDRGNFLNTSIFEHLIAAGCNLSFKRFASIINQIGIGRVKTLSKLVLDSIDKTGVIV